MKTKAPTCSIYEGVNDAPVTGFADTILKEYLGLKARTAFVD